MPLHVKTFTVPCSDRTVYATLQVVRTENLQVRLQVRLSHTYARHNSREHALTVAFLNVAGELVQATEEIPEHVRTAVERAIAEALA